MLFVHGAGTGALADAEAMAAKLEDALGGSWVVRCPPMPEPDDPRYAAWRDEISAQLDRMGGEVVVVGHSLGASTLLKYLAEEEPDGVSGAFLISTPFWGAAGWGVEEYALGEELYRRIAGRSPVYLYHRRGDDVVPFGHLAVYRERLPHAGFRELDGQGHALEDLGSVASDIEALERRGP